MRCDRRNNSGPAPAARASRKTRRPPRPSSVPWPREPIARRRQGAPSFYTLTTGGSRSCKLYHSQYIRLEQRDSRERVHQTHRDTRPGVARPASYLGGLRGSGDRPVRFPRADALGYYLERACGARHSRHRFVAHRGVGPVVRGECRLAGLSPEESGLGKPWGLTPHFTALPFSTPCRLGRSGV